MSNIDSISLHRRDSMRAHMRIAGQQHASLNAIIISVRAYEFLGGQTIIRDDIKKDRNNPLHP